MCNCRSRKMLKNAPFLITIGVDTAENGPVSDVDDGPMTNARFRTSAERIPAWAPSRKLEIICASDGAFFTCDAPSLRLKQLKDYPGDPQYLSIP